MASRTQRSFISGEIAPALQGRSDLLAFSSALALCRNFIVMPGGGVTNRAGFGFVARMKASSTACYLSKLIFSDDAAYIIEVGHQVFRFFSLGAVIGAPYELATPYVFSHLAELKFSVSGNVVTITHKSYRPRELVCLADDNWTLSVIETAPSIAAPGNFVWTAGIGTTFEYQYQVTAVKADTYEESLPTAPVAHDCDPPTPVNPNALSWDAVADAVEYNIFLSRDGNAFGFIGTVTSTSFNDSGFIPDFDYPPPMAREMFVAEGDYPAVCGHVQQRRIFASTTNEPAKVAGSRIAKLANFAVASPIQDDDAITFTIHGNRLNTVRAIEELNERPILLSSSGIRVLLGDDTGALTPTAIHPRVISQRGAASTPSPVTAGEALIFRQNRSGILRAISKDFEVSDLTLLASHLFERYACERMDYADSPWPILWGVRNGWLLSLTYLPEQQVMAWARHDSDNYDSIFEDVIVVPEGNEDAVYVSVRRRIQGSWLRYLERMHSRRFTDIRYDAIFLDSSLTYDGRHAGTGISLAAAGWTLAATITLTAAAATFDAGDLGNAVVFFNSAGAELFRVDITGYTSTSVVTGHLSKDLDGQPEYSSWGLAVDAIAGLDHLEGKLVSILADGNVVAPQRVVSGAISLDACYVVIHAGLPILADLETLDLDLAEAELRDRKKNLKSVSFLVESSRGVFAGMDFDHLYEHKPKLVNYNAPPALSTELFEIPISSSWKQNGSIVLRQSDPLPVTVLAAIPNGEIGG